MTFYLIPCAFVSTVQVEKDHLQRIERVGVWRIRQLIHKAEGIDKEKYAI